MCLAMIKSSELTWNQVVWVGSGTLGTTICVVFAGGPLS